MYLHLFSSMLVICQLNIYLTEAGFMYEAEYVFCGAYVAQR